MLNSVFLDEALKRGMTGAILHVSKIVPLHKIPEAEVKAALDLIYDRRRPGFDPLQAYIALFQDRLVHKPEKRARPESVEERLKLRIVDGDRNGLEEDLKTALGAHQPLAIINDILLDGMRVVGDLFGAGKLQLPFVLQSAETMKAAVAYLEPFMERTAENHQKGTIVLATVKGDVHDIGKNLVDILLTNNGYRVVNLGIKQPLSSILDAAASANAHAVGMSGLLVKSTVVMRENLEEMSRRGIGLPVILGGAALTRRYVDEDCTKAYATGSVAYARDAFEGLALMEKVVDGSFAGFIATSRERDKNKPKNRRRELGKAADARPLRPVDVEEIRLRRAELTRGVPVPEPPFWGPRVIARVPAKTIAPYLNERMLYQFHWGFRKEGRSLDEFKAWAKRELRPTMLKLLAETAKQDIFLPQAAYGYWRCAADGNDVILFAEGGKQGSGAVLLPAPGQGGGPVHRRFLPRRERQHARRDRAPGGDGRPARLRGGAAMVRRQPLQGLPLSPRAFGRDGRGLRRISAPAHPGRAGFHRLRAARSRRPAASAISRQPLFLRLSRLPRSGAAASIARAAPRQGDRRDLDRGGPARSRAIDLGHRRHPPAGQILLGLRRARPSAAMFTAPDIWPIVPACRRPRTLRPAPPSRSSASARSAPPQHPYCAWRTVTMSSAARGARSTA